MNFTKEELFEIEKRFDNLAGQCLSGFAEITNIMLKLPEGEDRNKFISKVFNEHTQSYDLFRTISAKCRSMDSSELNEWVLNSDDPRARNFKITYKGIPIKATSITIIGELPEEKNDENR
jgi:hypothetical protein